MASAIGPGDWVECINVGTVGRSEGRGLCLRLGALYCVHSLGYSLSPGFEDVEVIFVCPPRTKLPHGRLHAGYDVRRFRPIYRPKADLIESLKAPPKSAKPRQREEA